MRENRRIEPPSPNPPPPQTLGEASSQGDIWLRGRVLQWILGHPVLAIAVVAAAIGLYVFVVRSPGGDPEAAVQRYAAVTGLDDVKVDCVKTDSRENGHVVYSCSIESGGVELANGVVLAECYAVDGKDAYPSKEPCGRAQND